MKAIVASLIFFAGIVYFMEEVKSLPPAKTTASANPLGEPPPGTVYRVVTPRPPAKAPALAAPVVHSAPPVARPAPAPAATPAAAQNHPSQQANATKIRELEALLAKKEAELRRNAAARGQAAAAPPQDPSLYHSKSLKEEYSSKSGEVIVGRVKTPQQVATEKAAKEAAAMGVDLNTYYMIKAQQKANSELESQISMLRSDISALRTTMDVGPIGAHYR